mmetsp:Transcript_106809/g.189818  ORF Transcript_106809/g.189818 Transcript_106809/m.189818 type:complete len:436 (+) Transcript_106809:56-1363(+)
MGPAPTPLDLVILGALTDTGRLACEYLASHLPEGLRWAMAGPDTDALQVYRKQELPDTARYTPLLEINVDNEEQLAKMAARSKVVCNFLAETNSERILPVVAACTEAGCSYVDITGEMKFMKSSMDRYDDQAKSNSALVIHGCSFDSLPSDLGAFMAATAMKKQHGVKCDRIRTYIMDMKGGVGGGAVNNAMYFLTNQVENEDEALKLPYVLDPPGGQAGPDTVDSGKVKQLPVWDDDGKTWAVPFLMASVNARVVRRSNALTGYAYGEGASYGEVQAVPGPISGLIGVLSIAIVMCMMAFLPTRWLLQRHFLQKQGGGTELKLQNEDYSKLKIVAVGECKKQAADGSADSDSVPLADDSMGPPPKIVARVETGTGADPGPKCTALMSIEAGLCVCLERQRCHHGGVMTPAAGLGQTLVDRLNQSGMRLYVETSP